MLSTCIPLRSLLLLAGAALCACGGAQSGDGDLLLPPDPEDNAPPDDSATVRTETPPPGAALQGAWWDLAVQAREVDETERHAWEAQLRGLADQPRQEVIAALARMAEEELTVEGIRRASAKAAAQHFVSDEAGADSAFERGALYVLGGMVARTAEAIPDAPDPIPAGAALLRAIRALPFPPASNLEARGSLEREARTAMGPSLGAQAEARSRR